MVDVPADVPFAALWVNHPRILRLAAQRICSTLGREGMVNPLPRETATTAYMVRRGVGLRNARWRGVLRSLGSHATSAIHRSR